MVDTAFFAALAFLEMLAQGHAAPAPSPVAPPVVPPGAFPNVGPFPIPPPGVIPPGVIPANVIPDVPVPPIPPPPGPPPLPVPVAPPVPPGTLPVMPPWNAGITPCPADSPPFPGTGWVPDTPVSTAVAARAAYWNALLWDFQHKTIVHPSVCEQFGGRWMQFAAAWHPGDQGAQTYMATEAWRLADAPPQPAPAPQPAPTPVVPPQPVVVQTPLQAAAVAMASALNAHGYKQADQGIYRTFQKAAGTTADGFPGSGTMGHLQSVLASMQPPLPMPHVPIYPWKAKPGTSGYDGFNAPTLAEWTGQAAPVPVAPPVAPVAPAVTPASGPPARVEPYPGPGAWQTNHAYIARYQSALSYLSSINPAFDPQGVDGKYGPHTAAAVRAFQAAHGLTQDGEAGPATAAALDAAMGLSAAA